MSGTRAEASSRSQAQVIDDFKNVQVRLKTLVLTLKDFSNDKHKINKNDSKSKSKKDSFFRELNQMRNQVTTYVDDIQRQVISLRPQNTHDDDYVIKVNNYLALVELTTNIFQKLNQLFTEIFDRFSAYIEELWNHMQNGDSIQARRVTQEFNDFFNEKTTGSNSLFNDIEKVVNDINKTERK